jgi:monofunctional biosynthetic peptidoglycan transglycosylase
VRRILLALLALVLAYAGWLVWGLPSRSEVRALARMNPVITSLMRQRDEEAKRAGRRPRRLQSWVPISSVSRHLIHAVVAAEDQKFFGHAGVDREAIKDSVRPTGPAASRAGAARSRSSSPRTSSSPPTRRSPASCAS